MTFSFTSLSSSSKGNCTFIQTEKTRILVDVGISGSKTEKLLKSIDINPQTIDAIFITHEHIDHIKGLGVVSRKFDIPICCNYDTYVAMKDKIGKIPEKNIKIFETGKDFIFRDLEVHPMPIIHDCADPVGFVIQKRNKKLTILTDTGSVTDNMIEKMKKSDVYYIEANHDEEKLITCKYPSCVKQRIKGEKGHLSNKDTATCLKKVLNEKNEIVILAHLSQESNTPLLAYNTVKKHLEEAGVDLKKSLNLFLARPYEAGRLREI